MIFTLVSPFGPSQAHSNPLIWYSGLRFPGPNAITTKFTPLVSFPLCISSSSALIACFSSTWTATGTTAFTAIWTVVCEVWLGVAVVAFMFELLEILEFAVKIAKVVVFVDVVVVETKVETFWGWFETKVETFWGWLITVCGLVILWGVGTSAVEALEMTKSAGKSGGGGTSSLCGTIKSAAWCCSRCHAPWFHGKSIGNPRPKNVARKRKTFIFFSLRKTENKISRTENFLIEIKREPKIFYLFKSNACHCLIWNCFIALKWWKESDLNQLNN